jgi:ABC-type multidrug transport system ATPase subunit
MNRELSDPKENCDRTIYDRTIIDTAPSPPSTYSKGMRQKVGIAIALAKKAEALLLDEPTSGLDPKASNEFRRC